MADDLSNAPQTGDSETAAPAVEAGTPAPAAKAPSSREAIDRAFATVESRPPTETERAAAVLREGAGADDRLTEAAAKAAEDFAAKDPAASERARKGWETRRENAKEAEKAEAKPAEAVVDPKAAVKAAEPAKVEALKPAEPSKHQPPARLSTEAKTAWEAAPEPLKAEVVRMHDEMAAGLTKHKEGAERWSELNDLVELGKKHYPNTPFKDVIKNYVSIDQGLADDPLGTIEEKILKPMGYTLRQVAEHVMGQQAPDADETSNELRAQIADLQKQLGSVTTDITTRRRGEEEQRRAAVSAQVESFAKANPRFDELAGEVEMLLASPKFPRTADPVADLKAAYERAERLNPAPSLSPPAPEIPAPDLAAQTRRGQASVSGAPGTGSNPAKKPVPSSPRDAVDQAFARLGL